LIEKIFKLINKFRNPVNWYNLRRLEPISRVFGFDRGTPIDRIYIEYFLNMNKQHIQGVICEIAEDTYSKKYVLNIEAYEIFYYTNNNSISNNLRFSFRIVWNLFRRRVL
jgi:hypothetical protein